MEYKNLQHRLFKAIFIDRVIELGSVYGSSIDLAIIDHAGTHLCDDLKLFKDLSHKDKHDLYNFGKFVYQIHNDRKSVITTMIKATKLFRRLPRPDCTALINLTEYRENGVIIGTIRNSGDSMKNKDYVNFIKLIASMNIISLDQFRTNYFFEYEPTTTIEAMGIACGEYDHV